jgi:hypothetical protein
VAEQFALTESSYVTVRLLQRFETLENMDHSPIKHGLTLTNSSGMGVKVRMQQAKE